MTKTAAITKFANAYRAYIAPKCGNADAATAYALQDLMNMVKNQEQYAVELILEEAAHYERLAA